MATINMRVVIAFVSPALSLMMASCGVSDLTPSSAINLQGCDVPKGISLEEAEAIQCAKGSGYVPVSGVLETATTPMPSTLASALNSSAVGLDGRDVISSSLAEEIPSNYEIRSIGSIFSCNTLRGKRIELALSERAVHYTFGKIGEKAELSLSVPRTQASFTPWNGFSRSMTYRVNVPTGDTTYSVFWSAVRDPESPNPVSAGVDVLIRGAHVTTVECDPKTVVQALEEVDLPIVDS